MPCHIMFYFLVVKLLYQACKNPDSACVKIILFLTMMLFKVCFNLSEELIEGFQEMKYHYSV